MRADRQSLFALVLLVAIAVLTGAFATLTLFAFPGLFQERFWDFIALVLIFLSSLVFALALVLRAFTQFAQRFYDLPPEDAMGVVSRLALGMHQALPLAPRLRVQEGRANPDGPTVLFKVGGPGYLSIAHDSAVVTSHFGKLRRILGPGLHMLDPFEKVWDVVDLRPQRRTVRVEFMTADGIPAYCEADVCFRIDGGRQRPTESLPFPYLAQAVLAVTTMKRALKDEGIQDWTQLMTDDVLDGVMRNLLEQYRMEEFLNPQYWLPRPVVPVTLPPQPITLLEAKIDGEARTAALRLGISVDRVQLGPVLPAEKAIPRQWLEFWRANLQKIVDAQTVEGEARYAELLSKAQVNAKVELVTEMLAEVGRLGSVDVPSELIVLGFVDVLRSMSERDPVVQQMMFEQAENLRRIVRGFL